MVKKKKSSGDDGYIIEYHQLGNSVKVSAIDPVTLTEVSIVGSPLVSDSMLSNLAIRKLKYVMGKADAPDEGDEI